MKKGVCVLVLLTISLIFSTNVSAASQSFKSYVDMPGGSTLTGKSRSYSYKNHKIVLIPTRLDFSKYDANGGFVQVDIGLDKKGLIFWDTVASGTVILRNLNSSYNLIFGNKGSGTFRYTFYTGNAGTWYGGFRADPVYMYSYE